ncbi:MAG: 4Fe-4S dicluster domain-containing protein [Deltaproteobacteria bacterium]|nr:4Fe-4S dicluster domain-containing protein [Deltaproteobacteria bacterium]
MYHLATQHTDVIQDNSFSVPNSKNRKNIEKESSADIRMCWTCGSCDAECPVNIATGRLRPQKIVRIANLGFLDELLHLPEIWYCLSCRRCMNVCPNTVSPVTLIEYVRRYAIFRGIISIRALSLYQDLFIRFQRVRWHAINHCFNTDLDVFTERMWHEWQGQPASMPMSPITFQKVSHDSSDIRTMMAKARTLACFTCGECSSACPVVSGRSVFDPRTLFRMINLGMIDELIRSPSIWLCIACGRCTECCSQLVDGQEIISNIKKLAIREGVFDMGFQLRIEHANQLIYTFFLDKIDSLLGQ